MRPLAGGTRAILRHDHGGRWTNERTGLGMTAARASSTTYDTPAPLDRGTVDSLLRFNAIARRIALREPQDATREGFELGDTPDAMALAKAARKRGVLQWIRRGRAWARAYGGSGILLLVDDGQPADQPIRWDAIRALRGARVLTRHELTPATYDWGRRSYRIGDVEQWQVALGHTTLRVHTDRVIPMQGVDLPDDVLQRDGGWGGSVFDMVWAELRNYQASLDYLPEFVSQLTQAVFRQKGLAAGVAAGKAADIAARYQVLVGGLSVLNALALDAESESLEVLQRPIAGLADLFAPLVQALVAAADGLPKVILFGETPGGLHAGSDAPEVRAWYDDVAAKQPEFYTPPLVQILDVMAHSQLGPTNGRPIDCEVEWLPLYQQTDQEIAAVQLTRAQRRSVDLASTCISPTEARRDPDVAEIYQLQPGELAPAQSPAGTEDPGDELDDDDELQPVQSADASAFPPGEALIGIKDAVRVLGRSRGAILADAVAGKFPMMRDQGRWKLALTQVRAAMTPHVFAPPVH